MKYLVLLSIIISTINLNAGRGGSDGLQFPQGRVHRFLRSNEEHKLELNRIQMQARIELENAKNRERRLIARVNARMKEEEEIKDIYEQADKESAEIIAAIDPLILKKIDLEGLD